MPRILLVDDVYPAFLSEVERDLTGAYVQALASFLAHKFGTADFLSRNLSPLGWDCLDVVANSERLQGIWRRENGVDAGSTGTILEQARRFRPDVIYIQNIHALSPSTLGYFRSSSILAGQCSYRTKPGNFALYDVVFTSFPHYLEPIRRAGARAEFVRIAFEPTAIEGLPALDRAIDVSFVGGLGHGHIWSYGGRVLERVARDVPGFRAWGYGGDALPPGPLRERWQGAAWGLAMYRIYLDSKIVLNRHGEIAGDHANNMRLYEATGCGACLLTDAKSDLAEILKPDAECIAYASPEDASAKALWLLEHDEERRRIAAAGRRATLERHTYRKRMERVDAVLRELLEGRKLETW